MISIIIPTYNEAATIAATVAAVKEKGRREDITEIIVADYQSTDQTVVMALSAGAKIVNSKYKGRAAQMNAGAAAAKGDILYFLHADTIPPEGFSKAIINSIEKGYPSGCFLLSFDKRHWLMDIHCWFTRFDINNFRFGDQSLFVRADIFKKSGAFREELIIMEDQEIIHRLKQFGRFKIIKKPVVTSARKYQLNGFVKTQIIFYLIYFMHRAGFSQKRLVSIYKKLLKQDKL